LSNRAFILIRRKETCVPHANQVSLPDHLLALQLLPFLV